MSDVASIKYQLTSAWVYRRCAFGLAIGSVLIFFSGSILLQSPAFLGEPGGPMLLGILAVGGYFFSRDLGRCLVARRAQIVLDDEGVVFPAALFGWSAAQMPYTEIYLLMIQGGGPAGRVVVGGPRRNFVIAGGALGGETGLKQFYEGLRYKLGAQPSGGMRLANMEEGLRRSRRLMSRRARGTEGIVAVLGLAYLAQVATGAIDFTDFLGGSPSGLVRMGANVAPLVKSGEWYRMVTGTLLHGGLLHIYLNGIALLALGGLLERLLGFHRLILLYVLSALGGSVCSIYLTEAWLSVGASGAVFGFLGALAALQVKWGDTLPIGFGQSRRWWFVILSLNALLPFVLPQIDMYAHLGGFCIGFVSLYGMVPKRPTVSGGVGPARLWLQTVSMVGVGLFGAGVAHGVEAFDEGDTQVQQLLEQLAQQKNVEPDIVNYLAWEAVSQPGKSRALVRTATDAVGVLAEQLPERHDLRDTEATGFFLLGEIEKAVAGELAAFAVRPDRFIASQLVRFLTALPTATLNGHQLKVVMDGSTLELRGKKNLGGQSFFFRCDREGESLGLAAFYISPGQETRVRLPQQDGTEPFPMKAFTFVPIHVEKGRHGALSADAWRFWPVDEDVLRLPSRIRMP